VFQSLTHLTDFD